MSAIEPNRSSSLFSCCAKKAPDKTGAREEQGRDQPSGTDQKPLPEEAFYIAGYRRSEVCAGPSDSGSMADGWSGRADSRGEHGGNHDAHCCRLPVHGALLFDEDHLHIRRGGTRSTVTDITLLSIGVSLPVAMIRSRRSDSDIFLRSNNQ